MLVHNLGMAEIGVVWKAEPNDPLFVGSFVDHSISPWSKLELWGQLVVQSELNALVKWLDRWRLLPVMLNLMLVFKSVELSFFMALLLGPEPPSSKLDGHLS